MSALRVRWLGKVSYSEALSVQRQIRDVSLEDYLLMLEHPHTVTLGSRGKAGHILTDVEALGATVCKSDRGGEATYHGPGQLVVYPILTVPGRRGGGMVDTAAYAKSVEQVIINALTCLGLNVGRLDRCVGVWVDPESEHPRKIGAVGLRLARARSMHGFSLNVNLDLSWFERIVPCGETDQLVTSLAAEGVNIDMQDVVDLVAKEAGQVWARGGVIDRADVAYQLTSLKNSHSLNSLTSFNNSNNSNRVNKSSVHSNNSSNSSVAADVKPGNGTSVRLSRRLTQAGVDISSSLPYRSRKPEWVKVAFKPDAGYRQVKSELSDLKLVTVCEEAGCPNISECWNDGTATFMILGKRCTRSCSFCLVDTRKPMPPEASEPARVAEAAARMGLDYVVITMVARDDLDDGGAAAMAATVQAVRERLPDARVETLISDLKGDKNALQTVLDSQPDVLNHNIETVARLQRAVRSTAGYARSLAVLSRAKSAGFITKSSIIVGMGETHHEIVQTLADLRAIGTDIVTIGQYLRPSASHLPVAHWWEPEHFLEWKQIGESLGISHVESSPLTRSSYHAGQAAQAASAA